MTNEKEVTRVVAKPFNRESSCPTQRVSKPKMGFVPINASACIDGSLFAAMRCREFFLLLLINLL